MGGAVTEIPQETLDLLAREMAKPGYIKTTDSLLPAPLEIRHTSPTGGQKGKKPERYDLIPLGFVHEVKRQGYVSADELYDELRRCALSFWNFDDLARLAQAARLVEQILGGEIAARHHIANVYGPGAIKYDDNNWRKGYPWSWSYAALHRHLEAWHRGEMIDVGTPDNPGTKAPHLACVWFHLATLWTYATEGLGTDDRPRKEAK